MAGDLKFFCKNAVAKERVAEYFEKMYPESFVDWSRVFSDPAYGAGALAMIDSDNQIRKEKSERAMARAEGPQLEGHTLSLPFGRIFQWPT